MALGRGLSPRHVGFFVLVAVCGLSMLALMRDSEAEVGREDFRARRELLTVPTRERAYKEVDPLAGLLAEAGPQAQPEAWTARLQREVNLLVSIISGGSNETLTKAAYRPSYFLEANKERAGNREAVLSTWAHDKTFFVTNEPVNTNRVIHLRAEYEKGGRDGLPNKVKGMWKYLYENHVRNSN